MERIRLVTRGPLARDEARNVESYIEEGFDLGEGDRQIAAGLRLLLAPRPVRLWRDVYGALCVVVDQPAESSAAGA